MLSAHELARLCERLGLSGEARAIVDTIRSSPPTRRVRSAAGNVSVRYPSRKMGVTIQAESHRVELAGLYEYEHDQQVLEFYDQPPAIKLIYQARNGRQVSVWHTPDYFVLRTDGIGWQEWKTDDGLERLSQTMPQRYCRDAVGHWRCPPGEASRDRAQPGSPVGDILERRLLEAAPGRVPDVRPAKLSVVHARTPRMRASLRAATGGHRHRRWTGV
jgi:putative transposase